MDKNTDNNEKHKEIKTTSSSVLWSFISTICRHSAFMHAFCFVLFCWIAPLIRDWRETTRWILKVFPWFHCWMFLLNFTLGEFCVNSLSRTNKSLRPELHATFSWLLPAILKKNKPLWEKLGSKSLLRFLTGAVRCGSASLYLLCLSPFISLT